MANNSILCTVGYQRILLCVHKLCRYGAYESRVEAIESSSKCDAFQLTF